MLLVELLLPGISKEKRKGRSESQKRAAFNSAAINSTTQSRIAYITSQLKMQNFKHNRPLLQLVENTSFPSHTFERKVSIRSSREGKKIANESSRRIKLIQNNCVVKFTKRLLFLNESILTKSPHFLKCSV